VDDENHGDREGRSLPLLFLAIGALNVVMFFLSTPTHIERERGENKGKERGEKHGEKKNMGLLSKR
jgi:hypothetical protein